MIVQINKHGVITVTAENKGENETLFSVANNANFKGASKYSDDGTATVIKSGRGQYDRSKIKVRKNKYLKECPVVGCEERVKNIPIHFHKKHGIHADGSVHDYFDFGTEQKPVKKPVVRTASGYKVIEKDPQGLLGKIID